MELRNIYFVHNFAEQRNSRISRLCLHKVLWLRRELLLRINTAAELLALPELFIDLPIPTITLK